jgi:hypothetical protein
MSTSAMAALLLHGDCPVPNRDGNAIRQIRLQRTIVPRHGVPAMRSHVLWFE